MCFDAFFELLQFSCGDGELPFLHTLTVFWLDFQGLGPPRILKIRKKVLLEKHPFLGFKKMGSEAVFLDFYVFLGSLLEALGDPKSQN